MKPLVGLSCDYFLIRNQVVLDALGSYALKVSKCCPAYEQQIHLSEAEKRNGEGISGWLKTFRRECFAVPVYALQLSVDGSFA